MMDAVQFDVAYRFSEYRAFVLEHLAHLTGKRPGRFTRMLVSAGAAVAFCLKKSKMPLCSFAVDATGIRRRTGNRELAVTWKQVTAVHRYSAGFLIEKDRGAMPIPYRCLDEEQRSSLEALVSQWENRVRREEEEHHGLLLSDE